MLSGNLEYLISSLPHLQFTNVTKHRNRVHGLFKAYTLNEETSSLISILNQEAAKYLSTEKARLFNEIKLDTIHHSEFQNSKYRVLSGFSKFSLRLKTQLKSLRDSRKEPPEMANTRINTIVLEDANPLEQEILIMYFKWQELEQLAMGHYSDFEALIAYKIKLLLMVRQWRFNEKIGYKKYLDLIKTRDDGR
jgi:hypothetical protein